MLQHDLSSVLILTDSHITGIVICRIVERVGLKPSVEKPDCQPQRIDAPRPFLVILDGGSDGRACDGVLVELAARRNGAGNPMPRIIMLANTNAGPALPMAAAIDRFVAKPVTPDALQPQILHQLAQVRIGS
jgi:CheY-like chemotaxis protein